jgi:LDH2 family malate/lactate/ureidoglycolate dehydrogenase
MTHSSEARAVILTPAALEEYARAIFVGAGAPDAVALRVAGSLVLANRSGHDSHGAIRIPQYIRDIQTGQLDPRAEPAIAREGPAWVLVDGRWTFGHETARFAMAEATRRARETGVALVSTIRTNHIGRLGEWAEQAAAARVIGMVGVAFSHAAALLVAPHQGAGRALSTNPLAIGLPREDEPPLVLDFATSIVPEGKVPKDWKPEMAEETGAFLLSLTGEENVAAIQDRVLTLMLRFFEAGLDDALKVAAADFVLKVQGNAFFLSDVFFFDPGIRMC